MWQLLGSCNSSQTRLRLLPRSCWNVGVTNSCHLRRTSTSTITASQQGHSTGARAQPAKPHSSRQPFLASVFSWILPGKCQGHQTQGSPAKNPQSHKKKRLMTRQGGGLPLSSTSFAAPLSSIRGLAVPFHGFLEVCVRGPALSPGQFPLSV